MKKYVWAALAAIAVLSGCAKEVLSEPSTSSETSETGYLVTFTAERIAEDATTRAVISPEDSKIINWSEGDEISVFDAAGHNCRFTLKEGAGTPTAVFEGTVTEVAESYTALYPYQSKAELEAGNNGSLHFNIIENVPVKTEQKAVEGSFDPEAAIMTARSESGSSRLQFRNLMGFIKLTPKSDCGKITFTPADWPEGVPCGDCDVVLEENDNWIPRLGGYGRAESISISGDIKAGKSYYIAAATRGGSLSFPKGFSITFSTEEIDTFKRTSKSLEIKRNTVTNLGEVEGVPESYLKFTADAEQWFNIENIDPDKFEYSVGDGEWKPLGYEPGSSVESETVKFGGEKGALKLRGKSPTGTWSTTNNKPGRIWLYHNENVKVRCEGDIRTLIDWENYKTVDTGEAVFNGLFWACKALVSAPKLPSTKLAEKCYFGMFKKCTSLEIAPELPAIELAEGCYEYMFEGCTSLYAAPKLPAKDVPSWAYGYMFIGCSSLCDAPDLPAEQISSSAYCGMFQGCSSLEGMPEIAATSIGGWAMKDMFNGCSNLTKITELHVTNLAESCFYQMFYGCSSLTEGPALPCTETAKECYRSMFAKSGLQTAPDLPATVVATLAYYSMFDGCQSLTAMPEIAATTVGDAGMRFMFKSCSNLKTSTDLKIVNFEGTYNCTEMFHFCTSLTSAPALPATRLTDHCYFCMFSGCTSLEEALDELPATVLENYCYGQMFYGCSKLKIAPRLPAERLATNCYMQMFSGCIDLIEAPQLPAEKMAECCYQSMFNGCSSLVSVPVLKFTEVATTCCRYMFEKCSKLETVTLDVNDFDNGDAFTEWLDGTAADGKLHIRAGLNETTKWCMKLPSGWTFVEDVTD